MTESLELEREQRLGDQAHIAGLQRLLEDTAADGETRAASEEEDVDPIADPFFVAAVEPDASSSGLPIKAALSSAFFLPAPNFFMADGCTESTTVGTAGAVWRQIGWQSSYRLNSYLSTPLACRR